VSSITEEVAYRHKHLVNQIIRHVPLCLSQAKIWISNVTFRYHFYVQSVKMRGECLFCWYCWN